MIVNSRYLVTLAALAISCLAPVRGLRAQAAPAAAAAPSKIAVINIRNAIVATAEGKLAQAQLQSQFAPKQNELQSLQKQIEDLQRRLTEGARKAAEDSLRNADTKIAEYQDKLNSARNEIYQEQAAFLQQLHAEQAELAHAVRVESDARLAEIKLSLAKEAEVARENLASQAETLAGQIADAILSRRVV